MHCNVTRRTVLLWAMCLFLSTGILAQTPDSTIINQQTADSLIALLTPGEYDSLMTELDELFAFLEKPKESYFDISLTAGNSAFTLKNLSAATVNYKTENRFVLSPAAGYFHKSGLGLQYAAYAAATGGRQQFYQQQLSLSYDYLKGEKMNTGVSYTRNKVKDTATDFYTSPFQHNFQAYATWKKTRLRPALSFSFSKGKYTEQINTGFILLSYNADITEFATTASLRYTFTAKKIFGKKDYLLFSPRAALIASGQKITTLNENNDRRINRLISTGLLPARSVNKFAPQVLALFISADYIAGKFYLHPLFYIDYYLHTAERRSFTTVSLTAGFMF
jgi:hypothetical protein